MRAVRQLPGRPDAGRRGAGRHGRAALPLRRRGRASREGAGGLDDAAPPARRVPARRRARARGGGARGRAGRDRAGNDGRSLVGGERVSADVDRRRRRRERHHRQGASGSATAIVHGVAYEGNVPYPTLAARALRAPARARARRHPRRLRAGSSRRATTRTSASAAGRARGRSCASTCAASARRTASTGAQLEDLRGHRLPLRRPGTRIAGERALLVGDAAGLIDPVSGDGMYECFVSAELAAAAILDLLAGRALDARAVRGAVDARARAAAPRVVEAEAALDRWPRASWRSRGRSLLWRSVERLLLGELRIPGEQRGLARLPLRLLDGLGS